MKLRLLAPLLLLTMVACRPAPQPAPPAAVNADPEWRTFADAYIEATFKGNPSFAIYQGRHEFDGQLTDFSRAAVTAEIARLNKAISDAIAFDGTKLSAENRFERDYLVAVSRGSLFWLDTAQWPFRNPAWYVGNQLDPNVYVARPYAAADVRLKAFVKYTQGLPAAAAVIKENLSGPLPRSYIDYGNAAFKGYADYFGKDVKLAFAEVKDASLQAELDKARSAGAATMRDLAKWILAKRKDQTEDFALGDVKFSALVGETEGVNVSLEELEKIGRADLARNQAALKEACDKFAPGKSIPVCVKKMQDDKPADGAVAEARRQSPQLKAFLVKTDLVSIPGDEESTVRESPPFNSQNSAYTDIPGPYEKGLPSVYYISPPDPAWSKQMQHDFVMGKMDLLSTTVHEVWPGHFLNFLHSNRSSSIFGKVFVGYGFAEGWAHYAEELVIEAGLNDGDAETHIGQLANALKRDCRYLSAIGLHARGMTQEQSRKMFREQCYQTEGESLQQSARGTYDPAYLNYTMGKLMIRKLREDWTASRGGRSAWKAFHDGFLSYGGPPIPLVRQAMMQEKTAQAVF